MYRYTAGLDRNYMERVKKFNFDVRDGYNYDWHDIRKEEISFSRRPFGGGSIIVWGCFGYGSCLRLVMLNGSLTADGYKSLLEVELLK